MTVAQLREAIATHSDVLKYPFPDDPERDELVRSLVMKSWPLYAKLVKAGLKDPLKNHKLAGRRNWASSSPKTARR